MKANSSNLPLAIAFLLMLAAAPLVQTVMEARRGDWPEALQVFRQIPTRDSLAAFERSLEDASVMGDTLRPWMQAVQFFVLGDGGAKAIVGRDGWMFYTPGVNTITQRRQKNETTVDDALAAVTAFRDELKKRGIRLLVMPAPNKESIYPQHLTRFAKPPARVINPETRAFLAGCRKADVEVIDLFSLYSNENAKLQKPLYLSQDTHWSPTGIDLAAREVAARIGNHGDAKFELEPVTENLHGDLVRMMRSSVIESRLSPESIEAVRVNGTKDAMASQVFVLGDSFSRIFQTDEPGEAGFISQLAYYLGQPVESLVNDGGAATLVRQELSRRPHLLDHKKVVVWEFTERDLRLATEGWQVIPMPIAIPDAPVPGH